MSRRGSTGRLCVAASTGWASVRRTACASRRRALSIEKMPTLPTPNGTGDALRQRLSERTGSPKRGKDDEVEPVPQSAGGSLRVDRLTGPDLGGFVPEGSAARGNWTDRGARPCTAVRRRRSADVGIGSRVGCPLLPGLQTGWVASAAPGAATAHDRLPDSGWTVLAARPVAQVRQVSAHRPRAAEEAASTTISGCTRANLPGIDHLLGDDRTC